jgi:hypothetical protein
MVSEPAYEATPFELVATPRCSSTDSRLLARSGKFEKYTK